MENSESYLETIALSEDSITKCHPGPEADADLTTECGTDVARVSLSSLPFDILVLILKQVYQTSRRSLFLIQDTDWDEWDDHDEWDPTNAFPHNIASVCTAWRHAMSTVSIFWTRVVIRVDEHPTPLETIRECLAWSADHPLDIRICRSAYHLACPDPEEGRRVAAAMVLLYPHMRRWKSLLVDTLHGASLPRPHFEMYGLAPQLVNLFLESADGLPRRAYPPLGDDFFYTPALKFLWVDGNCFRDCYVQTEHIPPAVTRLTVAQYARDGVPCSVHDLVLCIRRMRKLQSLKLRDLNLDCTGTGAPLVDYQLERIKFEGMDAPVIAEFYRLIDHYSPKYLTFKHCTFFPRDMDLGSTMSLSLTDIDEDQDLCALLDTWAGVIYPELTVTRCPGFNDALLEEMSVGCSGRWLCPNLKSLEIYECPNYSSGVLRRMIDARTVAHARSGFADSEDPWFVVTSVDYLDTDRSIESADDDIDDA